jgi:hypothetical protein
VKKGYIHGFLLGLCCVIGCASIPFSWNYYNTQMSDACYDNGKLLGKVGAGGWPDLSLDQCKPDSIDKFKCVTLLRVDWDSLKADNMKCHQDLQDCEKGAAPTP